MKKIYLLLLIALIGFSKSYASFNLTSGTDMSVPGNWINTSTLAPAVAADFLNPANSWFISSVTGRISSGETFAIAGNLFLSGTGRITKTGGTTTICTISVGGIFSMNNSSSISNIAVGGGDLNIYLYANVAINNTASFSKVGNGGRIHIHFADTSTGGAPKTLTWSSTAISNSTSIAFDRRCNRLLGSATLPLPRLPDVPDSLNGTLTCLSSIIYSNDSAGFVIGDSATIKTTHPGGIDSTIQRMDSIWYSPKANYIFNGSVAQVTGITMPDTLKGSQNFMTSGWGTVTIFNTAGVSLSKNEYFSTGAALNLQNGTLTNDTMLTMSGASYVNVDKGTLGHAPNYEHGVNVLYRNLGTNILAYTTGKELQPLVDTTIGLVGIEKGGATITLGSDVKIYGKLTIDTGVLDASSSGYNITIGNHWTGTGAYFRNAESTASFVPEGGTVIMTGISQAVIGGTVPTVFNNVTLNDAAGLKFDTTETVDNQLTLTNGNIYLGPDTLILGPAALPVAPGAFSNTNMIVDVTAGEVIKMMNADGTFLYPVGDSVNYSPITLAFSGSGGYMPGTAYTGVKVHPVKHPDNANVNNYLKRYWSVDISAGITAPSYAVTAQYVPGDVAGLENKLAMGHFEGFTTGVPTLPIWTRFDPTNTLTHTLTTTSSVITSVPPNDYTGIDTTKPTVVSAHDTILCIPGTGFTMTATLPTGDPTYLYSWAPSTGLSATTGATVTSNPTTAGVIVYTLTITDGNGFTNTATTTVTVNPAPTAAATSNSPLCIGDSLVLVAALPLNVATYNWAGPIPLLTPTTAIASAGNVAPAAAGVYTLTLTNGPGANCAVVYTTSVTVNSLPPTPIVTGAGVHCDSATLNATVAGGTVYFQGTTPGGTSTIITPPIFVATSGTYYFRARNGTNCWGPDTSVTVTINPHPTNYPFTPLENAGNYCASDTGLHVIFSASDIGVRYQLYDTGIVAGAPLYGTGGALDYGLKHDSAWYSVIATDTTTGCIFVMTDSVLLNRVPLPDSTDLFPSTRGTFCAGDPGVDVQLSGTSFIDSYYLYLNNVIVDSGYSGVSGGPVDFGLRTDSGIYTAKIKDNIYGCRSNMMGKDSVFVTPLPNVYHVFGGGTECADASGLQIYLDGSQANIDVSHFYTYNIYNSGTMVPIVQPTGTGDTITYGPFTAAGNYTVQAVYTGDGLSCVSNMSDSADINVNPLPYDQPITVSGNPDYCVNDTLPTAIGLGASQLGVRYQLYYNGLPILAPLDGTGSFLSFGTTFTDTGIYSVLATDTTTGCTKLLSGNPTIAIHYLPQVYTLSGTGSFCNGSTGIDVQLSNAEVGVTYELLYGGGTLTAITATATGPLDFGIQTGMGTYTAIAVSATWGCVDTMAGGSAITVLPLPTLYNVTGGGAHCFPGISFPVGIDGSDTGVSYQLFRNDTVSMAVANGVAPGAALIFGNFTAPGIYTVVATRIATGCKDTMTGSVTITIYPLPLVDTVTGGGIYCFSAPGAQIGLLNSEVGVDYKLFRDTFSVPAVVMSGSGSTINFGYQWNPGTYTVTAINTTTGCVNNMYGHAINVRNPLPIVHTIAGGGNYCVGGPGLPIYLDATELGKRYELFRTTSSVGVLLGTGFALNYGLFSTAGTYNIVATDTLTGCVSNMAGTVTININSLPPVFTVSGGGTACAGAASFPVNLSGTSPSVRYRLWNGPSLVDSLIGTGSPMIFGPESVAGTFTVTAVDIYSLCTANMTGSATIVYHPLPAPFAMTGGGSYCAGDTGVHIGSAGSQVGVTYQPELAGIPIGGPQIGTGGTLDFGPFVPAGNYRMFAYDPVTGCTDTMPGFRNIAINALPHVFTVTGGGIYCSADSGVHIGLSGSDTGISYKLYNAGGLVGVPRAGTFSPLDFGLQTAAGSYIVTARDVNTGCHDTMSGTPVISIQPFFTPVVTLRALPDTIVKVGHADTVIASISGIGLTPPDIQWYVNNNLILDAANKDTLNFTVYFDRDTITCQVTSQGACAGITTTKMIIIRLRDDAVPTVNLPGMDVRLIPNPNKGAFVLKGDLGTGVNEELSVEVTNMLGQQVYSSKVTARGGIVDEHIQLSSEVANGMYLLNLRTGSASSTIHFVVAQ